ncbi:uncharacterized protein STAUR_7921 [Stigmatella aurantiaca DW4/3-1]|uniref:Uncharacterized protein n=1 Tax=Stigmatella aurantiaca (strain DW4/3-1) TaxID=378806 RepID=E3FPX3_STIAD|nr:uncharacterized protein STAUR_7921 [Stigmatella aurantiaca DW4/3-1]
MPFLVRKCVSCLLRASPRSGSESAQGDAEQRESGVPLAFWTAAGLKKYPRYQPRTRRNYRLTGLQTVDPIPLYRRALDIAEASLGKSHPDVAIGVSYKFFDRVVRCRRIDLFWPTVALPVPSP